MHEGLPRVLVVEDNLLIAMEMEFLVQQCGCAVLGPAGTVEEALTAIRASLMEGAVLDINLGNERVWPVADLLEEVGVPFAFATGYGDTEVPERFRRRPLVTKPLSRKALGNALREIGALPA